jgi:signal peptidase I
MEGYLPEDRELQREMRRVRRNLKGKRLLWGFIIWAFLSAMIGLLLMYQFFTVAVAHGPGMGDTAPSGSVVIFRRARAGQEFARGDVILIEREDGWEIKRVAAVSGDEVDQDQDGRLTVNGTAVAGYTALWSAELPEQPFTVPEGEYFVLGDRYDLSVDSRSPDFGTVTGESVVGTARYIVWPVYRIGEVR